MTDAASDDDLITRDAVIALIRARPGQLAKREIARELRLNSSQKITLRNLLREMEADGVIERRGRRGYTLPGAAPSVTVVVFTGHDRDGELIGCLAGRELDEDGPVVRLAAGSGGGRKGGASVGVGDRALCRLSEAEDGVLDARVIKKFAQQGRRSLGVVRRRPGGMRIEPVERGNRREFILAQTDRANVEEGDLVVFTVERERRHGLNGARIVEHIGRADAPHAATTLALHAHGIPVGFSDAEIAEANAAKPLGRGGREDLTNVPLLTIDPADARDHDDAVWAAEDDAPNNKGGWVVIVAIADVAGYVRPGSALDRGAERRGNSVYFPDRVVPMLPERLSTDLCSLREKEERPCFAVRMVFAADGAKKSHRFMRATMRSAAKLAYEQAQAAIDGKPDDVTDPLLKGVLKPLWGAYRAVAAARDRRAPLEIASSERRVRVDGEGQVASVERPPRLDAHRLIEEFMIQANVCAAETLEKKRQALLYRVHDEPGREKIEALADFLRQVGLTWSKGEPATPKRFNRLLAKAGDGDHAEIVNDMVLRTQSQAVYAAENIGHFGLNLARYAHFTSPIRRYADLIVHRALIAALGLGDDGLTDDQELRLDSIGEAISGAERRAMAAERDATDRYLSAFLAERIGSVFPARITGVTRAGLFLRLTETGADGLAPISSLGRERFVHDPRAHALIGEDTGGRYVLGRAVEARLVEAAPITGGLLLDVVTPAEPGPRPGRRSGRGGRPPPRRRKR